MSKVPFHHHDLGEIELQEVKSVISGPILTTGEAVARFGTKFSDFLKVNHCLGLNSCTGALHLAMISLGIGSGDEVITTAMTFVATTEAIINTGATPVLVDVEPETGNMDADAVEAAITDKTKAIIPVHLYGLMCDMKKIRDIADRHNLRIIEDAAHCIEGIRDEIRPGQLSDCACFSFFATKNITCGEGGAVLTNNQELYETMKTKRIHGMNKNSYDRHKDGYTPYDVKESGWKYNMSNIDAAFLIPQFDRIMDNLDKRNTLYERYESRLKDSDKINFPKSIDNSRHARHLFTIWVNDRDEVLQKLIQRGIEVVVNYPAVHLFSWYKENLNLKRGEFPNAELIGDSTISLPFYPAMPTEHVDIVCDTLLEITGR